MRFEGFSISDIDEETYERIIEFNTINTNSTIFHDPGWSMLLHKEYGSDKESFNYCVAYDEAGELVGILPYVSTRVNRLISNIHSPKTTYHTTYGGPVSSSPEIDAALLKHARRRSRVVHKTFIYTIPGFNTHSLVGYKHRETMLTSVIDLTMSEEAILQTFSKKTRKKLRRFEKLFDEKNISFSFSAVCAAAFT